MLDSIWKKTLAYSHHSQRGRDQNHSKPNNNHYFGSQVKQNWVWSLPSSFGQQLLRTPRSHKKQCQRTRTYFGHLWGETPKCFNIKSGALQIISTLVYIASWDKPGSLAALPCDQKGAWKSELFGADGYPWSLSPLQWHSHSKGIPMYFWVVDLTVGFEVKASLTWTCLGLPSEALPRGGSRPWTGVPREVAWATSTLCSDTDSCCYGFHYQSALRLQMKSGPCCPGTRDTHAWETDFFLEEFAMDRPKSILPIRPPGTWEVECRVSACALTSLMSLYCHSYTEGILLQIWGIIQTMEQIEILKR